LAYAEPDGYCRQSLTWAQILKNEEKPAVELCAERDLSSYSRFTRSSVGEFMSLFTKTVAERTKAGQRQDVEEQSYTFHAYGRSEGVAGIIISDQEYPALVAHQLLSKILDEFLSRYPRTAFANSNAELPFPALKEYIVKYQDPHAADSIMKIQKELDETKIVLHKTIESVLERGEKIDNLVAKSDGLSAQSKMFYTQVCLFASYNIFCHTTKFTDSYFHLGQETELLLHCHVAYLMIPMCFFPSFLHL
jgi:synaptobrevin family protein YKT6